jgi:hypothetical protein
MTDFKRLAIFLILILFFSQCSSKLAVIANDNTAGETSTDFNTALEAADNNLKTKEGQKYDDSFGLSAGPWLLKALLQCSEGLDREDLVPFTVLVLVGNSGKAEEVLVRPETKVAQCLKSEFAAANHPKPPGPSWWVKMVIEIK